METTEERLTSSRYQKIRLFDVFILAPTMIYASTFTQLPDYIRLILLISGVCTLVFNGQNYLDIQKKQALLTKK